jgi:hypothetical protein
MEFHVVLVGDGVIVLASTSFAPVSLCEFESMIEAEYRVSQEVAALKDRRDSLCTLIISH